MTATDTTKKPLQRRRRDRRKKPASFLRKVVRAVLFLITFLIISLAVLIGIGRAYLEAHPEIKDDLTENLSKRLGIGLSTDDIGVRIRWSGPQITVDNLEFLHPETQQNIISFEQVQVVLDVPRYLTSRIVGVSSVHLQGADLFLQRRAEQAYYFNGSNIAELQSLFKANLNEGEVQAVSDSISIPKGSFTLDDINLVYQDLMHQKDIRIEGLVARIENNDQLLKVDLSADATELAEQIKLGISTPNPELHEQPDWQILFEAENLQLKELSTHLENNNYFLNSEINDTPVHSNSQLSFSKGESDLKIWLRIAANEIQAMNGTVNLDDLEFSRLGDVQAGLLNGLDFRFAYEHSNSLRSFRIDRVGLDGVTSNWPANNALQIKLLEPSDKLLQISPINRELTQKEQQITDPLSEEAQAVEKNGLEKIRRDIEPVDTAVENQASDELLAASTQALKMAELKLGYANLTDIAPVIESAFIFAPELENFPLVDWRQMGGELSAVVINLSSDIGNPDQSYNLDQAQAQFKQLAIPSVNKQQSISGLSGKFNFSDAKGQLLLNSQNLVYQNFKVFRNVIVLDTLKTELNIEKSENGWNLESENLYLQNQDFSFSSSFGLNLPEKQSPILDMRGELKPSSLQNIKNYYPAKTMSQKLLKWLEAGVSGGEIDTANFVFKGALKDYPFRNNEGEYFTQFKLKNLDLIYAENWPEVRLEEAELTFANESLVIDVQKARTADLESFPIRGEFKDLANSELELSINSVLDLQKTKAWINNSPLKETIGESLRNIDVSGLAQSDLKLLLPIKNLDELKLDGQIQFNANELRLTAFDQPFTEFTGEFNFDQESLNSDLLTANYLGQEIQANVKPLDSSSLISLSTEAQLGPFLGKALSAYVQGDSSVEAEVIIGGENVSGIQNIKIRSNLLGSALNLPAPFDKQADSLMPLNLNIDFVKFTQEQQKEQLRLSGNLGDTLVRARFDSLENNPESDWALLSLTLVGGENEQFFERVNLDLPRITVLGDYSHVDFDEWFDFLSTDSNTQMNDSLEVGLVDINLKKLDAIGQSFDDIKVTLVPNAIAWQAKVKNQLIDGSITFPRPWSEEALIQANLKEYKLLLPKEEGLEAIDFDPREIPNVEIKVDNFMLDDLPIGETSLRIKREENGARVESFEVKNPAYTIEATGGWFKTTDGETSLVSLQLDSTDLVSTLTQLGYAPAASASSASSLIELNWPGSPFDDILKNVSGSVSFKLLNGDLREVEPGAGRFLALLSIAQLPKRLSLDFRDVFKSGLRYDELSADFSIHQGQAYTNNMIMRGPVADLGVVGRVGLATRDFEQAAVVQADLGSSLPVAGALAGGLGVGAAVLIFSEIFKNPLKKATQVFYKIDGDWTNPKIVRTLAKDLEEIPIAPR